MTPRPKDQESQADERKGLCQGYGENGLCRLAATMDRKWCPWHWEIVVRGRSKAGGFEDFERWLAGQVERLHDYRWQMHSAAAWWDLVNGRPTVEPALCDTCGRNLLSPAVMMGTQPILDRWGKFCSEACWHPAYVEGRQRQLDERKEAADASARD